MLTKLLSNADEQLQLGQDIVRASTENLFSIGTVGQTPSLVVVNNNFRNVQDSHTSDWLIFTPGTMDPPQFYFVGGEG